MKYKVAVKLKPEIKDIQGETVTGLINKPEIKKIYTGKYYEIEATDKTALQKILDELLVNPITEEYEIL